MTTTPATPESRGRADELLRVSSSGRFFETASGQPWFWLGDTCWPICTEYTLAEAKGQMHLKMLHVRNGKKKHSLEIGDMPFIEIPTEDKFYGQLKKGIQDLHPDKEIIMHHTLGTFISEPDPVGPSASSKRS